MAKATPPAASLPSSSVAGDRVADGGWVYYRHALGCMVEAELNARPTTRVMIVRLLATSAGAKSRASRDRTFLVIANHGRLVRAGEQHRLDLTLHSSDGRPMKSATLPAYGRVIQGRGAWEIALPPAWLAALGSGATLKIAQGPRTLEHFELAGIDAALIRLGACR